MHYLHRARGIQACLGPGRRDEGRDYLRWYFTRPSVAESFAAEFSSALPLRADDRGPRRDCLRFMHSKTRPEAILEITGFSIKIFADANNFVDEVEVPASSAQVSSA